MSATTGNLEPAATNETDLLRAQIDSLELLYNAPPLSVRVSNEGGGLPRNSQTFDFKEGVFITRQELYCVLNRLRSALATREELKW